MERKYRLLILLLKRTNIIVFLFAALIAALSFFIFVSIPVIKDDIFLPYLLSFSVILLLYYCFGLLVSKQYSIINSILIRECDPEPFIAGYNYIISELIKKARINPNLDYCYVNLSAGLIAAGRYEEALDTLGNYSAFNNSSSKKLCNFMYYNNLCHVNLRLGRTEEAENNLDRLIKALAHCSQKQYKKFEKYLKISQYEVNIAKGVFDYAEKVFIEAFGNASSNYERVNSKYYTGLIRLNSGDIVRSKEAFQYVIEYGNKLKIVEEAKKYLSLY